MNVELLHILQHSLGLDQYGQGSQYRNHFVAGGEDTIKCRELVALGCMREHPAGVLSGNCPVFTVTPQGIDTVALESPAAPKPPKLTRSQQRYRDYLDVAECFDNFLHYLRYKTRQAQIDKGTYQ